jgi:oligoendopeptidase F
MALYQQFLEEKDIFIPKFKQFLSMGGSAKPTTIIGIMGQDINKREFWQKGVIYIESLIDKLEIMVNNTGNE